MSLSKTSKPEPVEHKDSKIEMKLPTNIKQEEAVSTRVQKQIVETELIAESKKDNISLETPKIKEVALKNKMSPVKASNDDIDVKTLDLAFNNVINELLKKTNKNKSALLGKAEAFMNSAKDKEIDVFTLMGVAMIESAYGTSSMALNKNNVGGLMGPNGGIRYRNVSDSINVSARVMHRNIYDKGLTNIHSVGMKGNYCCANASLRNTWVNNVTKFANQIRNEYNRLLQGETA